MSIHVEWENDDKTIVRWTLTGNWSWADFEAAQADLHALLATVDHTVDVIADMLDSPTLPSDTFTNFKRMERKVVPNRDRVVLVTNNTFVRTMAHTFNRVFRNRPTQFLLADSIEEAHQLIAQIRQGQ